MLESTFISESPLVHLEGIVEQPFNLGIAAARTCYSGKGLVTREDVTKDEKSLALRDKIASSTLQAGHLTTRQHAHFVFAMDKVSRQFIWSFLHSHPFYNSEQVSQRYVKVSRGNYTIPPMAENLREKYVLLVDTLMDRYQQMIDLLMPDIRRRFFELFPQRKKTAEKYEPQLKKRAYEIARYILPVATHAYLYHTISALTLMRYHRLSEHFDTGFEQQFVVKRMIEEVLQADPDFAKDLKDPIPLEETPEYAFMQQFHGTASRANAKSFIQEFDQSLDGKSSVLIDYKKNAEPVLAQSVRTVLGIAKDQMSDAQAIDIVLNPEKNPYFGDTVNVNTLSKLGRTMFHPHYTFRKKISHTADSQDQRHRMTPGSRPILWAHVTEAPDYIVPMIVRENPEILSFYEQTMTMIWKGMNELLADGLKPEFAMYLLPNAFPIRFEESGDLLNQHHKWRTRACYTAQEEIFFATIEEIQQVKSIHPQIAAHILAPCYLRMKAGETPYCPEGDRYCGVPVWKKAIEEYQRIL